MELILVTYALMFITVHAVNYDNTYKATSHERSAVATLNVTNGGKWGEWIHTAYCPPGTFARGVAQKLEPEQGTGDDTALNNVALFCAERNSTSYKSITSSPAPGWGNWTKPVFCEGEDAFLSSFILQVEPSQGVGDDTAANYVKFKCRKFEGSESQIIDASGRYKWGEYGDWSSSCPSGSAICGMITKWEAFQGSTTWNDDSALNDVMFYCCKA